MAPVTNEILGGTSAPESAPQSVNPESKAALRADAVSLEVPIKVHGSRPTSGANSQSERFEEQTTTMIIFPEGGVLRMATSVAPGQMLVLTNQKSRQDAICRVVKVRKFSASQSYVEVEFTRPQPAYWGVYFASQAQPQSATATSLPLPKQASDSFAGARSPAPPPEPPAPELIDNIADLHDASHAPLPLPAPPAKPASPFASIGTQEKIQPAAAATTRSAASKPAVPPIVGESFTARPASVSERVPAGSVANINSLADLDDVEPSAKAAPTSDPFGFRLNSNLPSTPAEPRQNWLLIAASIVVLLAAAAGGAWYFHSHFAKSVVPASVAQPAPAIQQSAAPTVQQPAPAQPASAVVAPSASNGGPAVASGEPQPATTAAQTHSPSAPSPSASAPERLRPTIESSPTPSSPASIGQPPAQNSANSVLAASAMTAHPLSLQHAISSPGDAPALAVGTGSSRASASLPSIGSSGVEVLPPPPATVPQQPAHLGGAIQQPKLLRSVMPVYPFAAREANVQGDVVIDTRIGVNGSVINMKVVSGPTMLRQAALDALRRWKYQPSKLDGKPVAAQMLVTIRFRL